MRHQITLLFLIIFASLIFPQDSSGLSDSLLLEGIDARFVMDKYINAIGGRENLSNVNDRVTSMTGTITGFDVKMVIYQKKPNLLRQEVQASGLDQIIIFDGEKGIIRTGEEKQNLEGDDLNKLKYEATMGLMLNPDSIGLKYELAGTRTLGDQRAYKINNSVDGVNWSSYYSLDSGLKLLDEKQVTTPSGTFLQEIYFKDYKEVEGVKYPFRIEQNLGSQELTFVVNSVKINQDLEDSLFKID